MNYLKEGCVASLLLHPSPQPRLTPSSGIPTTLSFILDSPAQHQPFLTARAFPSSTTPFIFSFFFAICALENSFPPPPAPLLGDLMLLMGLLPYGAGNTNPKTLPSPHEDAPGTAASPEGAGPAAVSPPRSSASSHPVPPPGTPSLPSAQLRAPLSGCCRPPHGPRIAPHAGGDAASAAARPQ